MRRLSVVVIPTALATLALGAPSAWATPAPAASQAPTSTSPATARYTPYAKITTQPDGTERATVYQVPAFTRFGGSEWRGVDNHVAEHPEAADEDGFRADGSYRPLAFGRTAKTLLRLKLDGGPVRLSTRGLHPSRGTKTGDEVTYPAVATDTDLTVAPSGAGFRTLFRLKSANAPTAFTFHLSDPNHQLGAPQPTANGGYAWDRDVEPGVRFALEPAFAYEVVDSPRFLPSREEGSATLTVTATGDGFDITERISPAWLAGKKFPIELDPIASLGSPQTFNRACHIVDGPVQNSNHCGSTALEVGYGPGTSTTWSIRRSLLQFETATIPSGARVDDARLDVCLIANFSNTTLPISAHQANQDWTSDATWNQASTGTAWSTPGGGPVGSAISTTNVGGGSSTACPANAGSIYSWAVPTSLTQGWLDHTVTNAGVLLKAVTEPGSRTGDVVMRFGSEQATNSNMWPHLVVDYAEQPQPPAPVQATEDDQASSVSWPASPNAQNAKLTGYQIRVYAAATMVKEREYSCSSTCTVGSLQNGKDYIFGVIGDNGFRTNTNVETRSGTVTPYGRPFAPPAVNVATGKSKTATVSWSPPAPNGRAITAYTVTVYDNPGHAVEQLSCDSYCATDQRAVTFSDLTDGHTYVFGVRAYAPAGDASRTVSNETTATETVFAGPDSPTGVLTRGDGTVSVSWQPPAPVNRVTVTGYVARIYDTSTGQQVGAAKSLLATDRSTSWSGLTNGLNYKVQLTAAYSVSGNAVAFVTDPPWEGVIKPATRPGVPQSASASATSSSLHVDWTPPLPTDTGGEDILSYHIDVLRQADNTTAAAYDTHDANFVGGADIALPDSDPDGTSYKAVVYAVNVIGQGLVGKVAGPVSTLHPIVLDKTLAPGSPASHQAGDIVTYQLTLTNINASTVSNVHVVDGGPGIIVLPGTLRRISNCATAPCRVTAAAASTATLDFSVSAPPGVTTYAYEAQLDPGQRGCAPLTNTAQLPDEKRKPAIPVTVTGCGAGLGREPWWTFLSQDAGPQADASVNVANGNAVVSAVDTTVVQAHGHLAYALRRTYNSSAPVNQLLPGSLGAGWTMNVGELADATDTADLALDSGTDAATDALSAAGLLVPSLGVPADTITNPLAVVLVDADGTRHVFRARKLAAPVAIPAAGGVRGDLRPQALTAPSGQTLCLDRAYDPPAGVHLGLFRYVAADAGCNVASGSIAGYVSVRPDRLRSEYDATGRLLAVVDGSGVQLRYLYAPGLLGSTPEAGRLTAVFEPLSCHDGGVTPTSRAEIVATSCRSMTMTYTGTTVTVQDPARRTTIYHLDRALPGSPTDPAAHLIQVENPDQHGSVFYTYGGCGGSADQLCSISSSAQPQGAGSTLLGYAGTPGEPARVHTLTDRRGTTSTFTYVDASETDVNTPNPGTGDAAQNATHGQRQVFSGIDTAAGRIHVAETFDVVTDERLRKTSYAWDSAGCRLARSAADEQTADNDLCTRTTVAAGISSQGSEVPDATPSESTTFIYNPEGRVLRERRSLSGGQPLDTTYAYATQYVAATGNPVVDTDTIDGHGQVTAGQNAPAGDSLFAVSDRTGLLTPRGNAADDRAPYLTVFTVDADPSVPLNAPATDRAGITGATTPCSSIGPGGPFGTPQQAANTGLVCQVSAPSTTADGGPTVTRATYDSFGQKITATSAKALAEGQSSKVTRYAYFDDGGAATAPLDVTGSVRVGGWLRSITDPLGGFVAFDYDAAGNAVRSWDRDRTEGQDINNYPGPLTSSRTNGQAPAVPVGYAETRYGSSAGSSTLTNPWRYVRSATDPLGQRTELTVDENGNTTAIQPPRGTAAGTHAFDTVNTYDSGDLLLTTSTPSQRTAVTATRVAYDPFGNRVSTVGADNPNDAQDTAGRHATVSRYDALGRATATLTSRGDQTAANTGANCRPAAAADAPVLTGHTLCVTAVSYDHVDNPVSNTDANGAVTTNTFDAVHRLTDTRTDRNADGITQVRLSNVYDEDGNSIRQCTGRHFTEGTGRTSGVCDSSAVYAQHATYNPAGRPTTMTRYRTSTQPLITRMTYDADGNPRTVTDPRGTAADGTDVTITATFNLLDRRTDVAVPVSGSKKSTYSNLFSPAGDLIAAIAPGTATDNVNGPAVRVTGHSYDKSHRPVDTVQALQTGSTSLADAAAVRSLIASALSDTTNQTNLRTRVQYDADGHIAATYPSRAFTADQTTGTTALLTSPDGRYATRTEYDNDGRPVTTYRPRAGGGASDLTNDTTQAQQCPTGAPGYPADALVCRTSAEYGPAGNMTVLHPPTTTGATANSRKVDYVYTDDGLIAAVKTPDPSAVSQQVTTSRTFDGAGRVVDETNPLLHTTSTAYTADGLVATVTGPVGATGLRRLTRYRYNADGQPIGVETPRTNFDVTAGWETGQNTPVEVSAYYADGLLQSVTAGRTTSTPASQFPTVDNTTSYSYDGAGNATAVGSPNAVAKDNSNPIGAPTRYTYTADGLLASTSQPVLVSTSAITQSRTTSYGYDDARRKASVHVALVGSGAADGGTQSFTYFPSDLLRKQTGRSGQGTIDHAYDADGNTTKVAGASITVTGSYYLDGLPLQVKTTGRSDSNYAYDGAGQMTGRVSGGNTQRFSYNHAGLVSSLGTGEDVSYNQLGQAIKHTHMDGLTQKWGYGSDDSLSATWVATSPADTSPAVLATWRYYYDELGRIISQSEQGSGASRTSPATSGPGSGPAGLEGDTSLEVTYRSSYDDAGRLSGFTDARGTRTVRFDHDNNRTVYGEGSQPDATKWTYRADDSIATSTLPGDASGGAVVTRAYQYHPFGGVKDDGCLSYTYDGFDRLAGTAGSSCRTRPTVTYGYDGLDRQTSRTTTTGGTSSFSFDGWDDAITQRTTKTTTATTTTTTNTSYRLDPDGKPLTAVTNGTADETLFDDGTGSIGLITAGNPVVRCVARYDAYGNPDGNTNTAPAGSCASGAANADTFYRSNRKDVDTGNYQLGSRTYNPANASFLTPDSYRTAGSGADLSVGVDPLTRNTYSYVNGDPINLSDPSGHRVDDDDGRACDQRCAANWEALGRMRAAEDSERAQHHHKKHWWEKNPVNAIKHVAKVAAPWVAAAITYAGCTAATGGGGAIACGFAAGAVYGAVHGALNCGGNARCIAGDTIVNGVMGAAGGVVAKGAGIVARAVAPKLTAAVSGAASRATARVIGGANRGLRSAARAVTRRTPAAAEGGGIAANKAAGDAARDVIASRYPGAMTEVTQQTSMGARRLDVLTDQGLAIESKVGRTSLTSSIETQIAKDVELMGNPLSPVNSVQWVFSRSAVTGRVGPTRPLQDALDKAGIDWVM